MRQEHYSPFGGARRHFNDKKNSISHMAINVGDKAPDFTLRSSEKEQISLKNYRGQNVVLLFFPMAFTGVCTKELCQMRDSIADYGKLNAQVLAVSVDSVFTLDKWKQEQNFGFPLLSDFNKTVSKKYDSLYKEFVFEMKGVSKRSAFVIDGQGTVQYAEVLENAGDVPNFDAVKATLAQL
jgi:glutaredoxin-dependent peroxiredoxin